MHLEPSSFNIFSVLFMTLSKAQKFILMDLVVQDTLEKVQTPRSWKKSLLGGKELLNILTASWFETSSTAPEIHGQRSHVQEFYNDHIQSQMFWISMIQKQTHTPKKHLVGLWLEVLIVKS